MSSTELATSFGCGLLFATGLAYGGMLKPSNVRNFLDIAGPKFDPALAFVMAGGVGVMALAYPVTARKGKSMLGKKLDVPTRKEIDWPLLVGAALFGIGWAGGICPGPGLVASTTGESHLLVFSGAMVAGMLLEKVFQKVRASWADSRPKGK
jgi:uncharacterized membrane protein YedE/YeeE